MAMIKTYNNPMANSPAFSGKTQLFSRKKTKEEGTKKAIYEKTQHTPNDFGKAIFKM